MGASSSKLSTKQLSKLSKVWLLYLKHTRGDRGRLSLNILRKVCAFLHPLMLADVTESSIKLFNFQRYFPSNKPRESSDRA